MKRIIVCVNVMLFFVSMAVAEPYYRISQKDYYELCAEIAAIKTDIKCKLYCSIDRAFYLENLEKYKNRLERCDTEKQEMTADEKLSILGGKISLLEMKLLKLRGELKNKGIKIE